MNLKNDVTAGNLFILRERLRVSFSYAFKFYFMIVFGSFITYDNSPRNRSRVLMLDGRVEASTTGMPALKGAVARVNRPLPASNRSPRNSRLEDSVEESAGSIKSYLCHLSSFLFLVFLRTFGQATCENVYMPCDY